MSILKLLSTIFIISLLTATQISTFGSPGIVVIVSNSIDMQAARELNKALIRAGIACFILRPDELWKIEHYSVEAVIYLGGPLAYEGVGEIVSKYLTEEEELSLMEKGAMGLFVKAENGKKIIIIAGNTRNETRLAASYFMDKLMLILKAPIQETRRAKVVMVVVGTKPSHTPVGGP